MLFAEIVQSTLAQISRKCTDKLLAHEELKIWVPRRQAQKKRMPRALNVPYHLILLLTLWKPHADGESFFFLGDLL